MFGVDPAGTSTTMSEAVTACAFTVKVLQGTTVVAKATKSLAPSPDPRFVYVPTTSAGKNLAHNDVVTVKIKTSTGTTSTTVKLN